MHCIDRFGQTILSKEHVGSHNPANFLLASSYASRNVLIPEGSALCYGAPPGTLTGQPLTITYRGTEFKIDETI